MMLLRGLGLSKHLYHRKISDAVLGNQGRYSGKLAIDPAFLGLLLYVQVAVKQPSLRTLERLAFCNTPGDEVEDDTTMTRVFSLLPSHTHTHNRFVSNSVPTCIFCVGELYICN